MSKGKAKINSVTGACGCKADEFEYQDVMSGYWWLQHRKTCPLRRQYEEGEQARRLRDGRQDACATKGPGKVVGGELRAEGVGAKKGKGKRMESGKRPTTNAQLPMSKREQMTEAELDDLQAEKELLVDLIETIELLLVQVGHAIDFHGKTGIFKPGLTDLEFARMIGMKCEPQGGSKPRNTRPRHDRGENTRQGDLNRSEQREQR